MLILSNRLLLAVALAVVAIVSLSSPALGATDTDAPVTGEGTVEYNDKGFVVYHATIDTPTDETVFINEPEHTQIVSSSCLIEKTDGYLSHKIRPDCDSASIFAIRNIKFATSDGNGSGLYYPDGTGVTTQTDSGISVWWFDSTPSLDEGWRTRTLDEVATMETQENITISAPYMLLGDAWETNSFRVNRQDVATVHQMDSVDGTHQRALKNISVPGDSERETVSVVIPDGSRSRTGELGFGGAYYDNHNSIIVDSSTDTGAMFHEYSHSQQSYEPRETMNWMVEASATYDANLEMTEQGDRTTSEMRETLNLSSDEQHASSILSSPSTWERLTPYVEGQTVLAMIDSCIQNNSNRSSITDVQRDLRSPGTTLTFELFVGEITDEVQPPVREHTVSDWLRPYVYGQQAVTHAETMGSTGCWESETAQSNPQQEWTRQRTADRNNHAW